jgi:hypothetical protein
MTLIGATLITLFMTIPDGEIQHVERKPMASMEECLALLRQRDFVPVFPPHGVKFGIARSYCEVP